jgi:DNA-binding transcriptional ArsR family regulator
MYATNAGKTNKSLILQTPVNDLTDFARKELGGVVSQMLPIDRDEQKRLRHLLEASAAPDESPTQRTARQLYLLGFNVLPVPYAQKGGWPWKPVQFTRLPAQRIAHIFSGQCNIAVLCGKTSQNLFVIDCETEETFHEQGQKLRENGIPLWSVRSGGSKGGGHYYLRCLDGEIENIRSGILQDLEVRGNRCYALLPPSVHPDTGALYGWAYQETLEPPCVHIEDINWLPLKLTSKRVKNTGKNLSPFHNLARKTCEFIQSGAPVGERNHRLFAAACDLAGNGYDFFSANDLLSPSALNSGLNDNEVHWTLKSAYREQREPCRKYNTDHQSEKVKTWQQIKYWIEQQDWRGRTGQTDRALMLACCERLKQGGNKNNIFRASVRELCELARLSKPSVLKGLERLKKRTFLVPCGTDKISFANLYRFADEILKQARELTIEPIWLSNSGQISLNSDAAERGALGKTAVSVYQGLLALGNSLRVCNLALALKLSRDQVRRALRKLLSYGMVKCERKFWFAIRVDNEWLDEHVAAAAGTLGRGKVRRVKHQEERAEYAARQIMRARRQQRRAVPQDLKSDNSVGKPSEDICYWECPNCGQHYFSDNPPDMCDYCQDFTTWRRVNVGGSGVVSPDAPVQNAGDAAAETNESVDADPGVQLDLFPSELSQRRRNQRE